MSKPKKKLARRKGGKKPRQNMSFRMPGELAKGLDRMAVEVGMSRTQLMTLLLTQAVEMHQASEQQPRLFGGTEALIEARLRRAFGGGDGS